MSSTLPVVVEELRNQFAAQLQAGQPADLGGALSKAPEAVRMTLFRELLLLELSHRPPQDNEAARANYLARFPEYAEIVDTTFRERDSTLPASPPLPTAGGSPLSPPTAPLGQLGRYRLLERVGRGGMGVVYRAEDPALGRVVAVKVPHLEFTGGHETKIRERFLREARHAARVRHPHVCPIYDVGEVDDTPYVVMEFIEGQTLAQVVSKRKRFGDPVEAVSLVRELLDALAAVHAHGIIHRDVKPGNVLINQLGRAILTDFGLARSDSGTVTVLTAEGALAGTPMYMSPEQAAARTGEIDRRTDIYAVGVVLYQMLTGRLPFYGPPVAVVRAILEEPFPRPSQNRPDLSAELEAIILKAVARRPEDRYQTAEEFSAALARWHPDKPAPPRSRGGWVALAGVVILAVGLILGFANGPKPVIDPGPPDDRTRPVPSVDPEREVVEWVFSVGGHVRLMGDAGKDLGPLQPPDKLPNEPFLVFNVNLTSHAHFVATDLDRLQKLKKLSYLSLSGLPVNDEALLKLRAHSNLNGLYLDDTLITDIGLGYLQNMPSLTSVSVHNTRVTPDGIRKFRAARPMCELLPK